ncbi:MAG: hypothetical protein KJ069_31750 [Anaerolineae bacterium]|nr:hypothetical protein [Anaerolineae bacterium]
MIVLDENLKDVHLIEAIAAWYPGSVTHIKALRLQTVIKDDAIPELLLTVSSPTFVTINVDDFWRKVKPHQGYCIVTCVLPQNQVECLSGLLRDLLGKPEFDTKTARMGKVIRTQNNRISYYERDGRIKEV